LVGHWRSPSKIRDQLPLFQLKSQKPLGVAWLWAIREKANARQLGYRRQDVCALAWHRDALKLAEIAC
jgi:hypothetical protein